MKWLNKTCAKIDKLERKLKALDRFPVNHTRRIQYPVYHEMDRLRYRIRCLRESLRFEVEKHWYQDVIEPFEERQRRLDRHG